MYKLTTELSEWTPALALRRFKEEAVLAHVVRSPPTIDNRVCVIILFSLLIELSMS
jgi:hypothetical protein